jgi:hypothetical protein
MLGPVDLLDWDYDELDAAKAELRLHPALSALSVANAPTARRAPARIRTLAAKLTSGAAMTAPEIDELRVALATAGEAR